ncbi:sigma-54-dependent Fis family transcriptional regulator [Sesbania bispinosa]|nr:sigma-54-dependent Fis family transcriptional regulator [Sesbania bispinosa]
MSQRLPLPPWSHPTTSISLLISKSTTTYNMQKEVSRSKIKDREINTHNQIRKKGRVSEGKRIERENCRDCRTTTSDLKIHNIPENHLHGRVTVEKEWREKTHSGIVL